MCVGFLILFVQNAGVLLQLLVQLIQMMTASLSLEGGTLSLEGGGSKGSLGLGNTGGKVVLDTTDGAVYLFLHGINAGGYLQAEIFGALLCLLTILVNAGLEFSPHLDNLVLGLLLDPLGICQNLLAKVINNFCLTLLGLGQCLLIGSIVLGLQLLGTEMQLGLEIFKPLALFHGVPRSLFRRLGGGSQLAFCLLKSVPQLASHLCNLVQEIFPH